MAESSRFGIAYIQDRPFAELRAHWRAIEQAGVHSLWVGDHLTTYPVMGTLAEPWTTLGAMAVCTSSIRIGVLVVNITYRNPAVLAMEALTVDHVSGGRLELGIGAAGTKIEDGQIAGVDEWTPSERLERFAEFVECCDGLLTGSVDSYEGRYYSSKGFDRGRWVTQQPRPPLTIAAQGPKSLRVAARFGDTWNGLGGWGRSRDELVGFMKSSNARLDELAGEFGREPSAIRRSMLVGRTGFEWWDSVDSLRRFVETFAAVGVQDFIFSLMHTPLGTDGTDRFLDLLAPILA